MKFKEYVPLAMRTCKQLSFVKHVEHMALGMAGEMGEIIDAIKKAEIYGKELDRVNLAEEVGDVFWYAAGFASTLEDGENLLDIANIGEAIDIEELHKAKQNIVLSLLATNGVIAELCLEAVYAAHQCSGEEYKLHARCLIIMAYAVSVLLGIDLEKALDANIEKLAKRYGDKYSDYSALNRDTDAEREILEGKV